MITVTFENHGQDFLEWDIEAGKVVDCRPSQAGYWIGTEVHNLHIQAGDNLIITEPSNPNHRCTLLYPVRKVSWPKPMSHNITTNHHKDYRAAWSWPDFKGN